jgi:hypothetical protein
LQHIQKGYETWFEEDKARILGVMVIKSQIEICPPLETTLNEEETLQNKKRCPYGFGHSPWAVS